MKRHINYGWSTWAVAVAALIFGLALMIQPGMSASIIITVVCTIAIVMGAVNIVSYLVTGRDMPVGDQRLATGIVLAVLGTVGMCCKVLLLSFVPWIFGIGLFVSGVSKLQYSANMRRMTYSRWWPTLIGAVISVVLGLLIVLHPFGTGLALIRMIGLAIVIEAVQDILSIRSYDKAIKTHFTD